MLPALILVAAASSPQIDLYTMGQGEHVFERFGHAAVCVVYDQQPGRSRCYNYGTTEFGDPLKLSWDFLRGDARFWVSEWPLSRMVQVYVNADRTVWRQRLPLTHDQVLMFQQRLEHDAKVENRYYTYHHFFDNCTTRIRDILDEVTEGRLARLASRPLGTTYRKMGARGLADYTAARVASDFTLGRPADKELTVYEGMFHPDILRAEVANVYGVKPQVIHERQGTAFPQRGSSGRHWTALLAAFILAPVVAREWLPLGARAKLGHFFLGLTGGALGLIAVVLWGLAVVSTVPELRYNEVLLLFWPTDLMLPFLGIEATRRYARFRLLGVLIVSALAALGVLVQPLFGPLLLPLSVFGVLAWPPVPDRRTSGRRRHRKAPTSQPSPTGA